MKNHSLKILSVIISVIMVFTVMPLSLFADATSFKIDSTGKILTITGSGKMTDYENNLASPYYANSEIETIIISEGVTHIGDYSFNNMPGLTVVDFPDSLQSIGKSAFYNCQALKSVSLGESVEIIDDYAFYYCFGLERVSFGNSLKKIGEYAFAQCVKLDNVAVNAPCEEIGSFAFGWCYGLKLLGISFSVKEIGEGAFFGCRNLTDVYYSGVESQWGKINIGTNNDSLIGSDKHYGSVLTTKDKMLITRDNNSFIHWGDNFFKGSELLKQNEYEYNGKYYIDDEYFEKLKSYGNVYALQKKRDSFWDGSCAGLSISMALVYLGKISLENFVPNKHYYYYPEVLPKDNHKFRSLINYYQMSQELSQINDNRASIKNTTDFQNKLKDIVRLAKKAENSDLPFIYTFYWTYLKGERLADGSTVKKKDTAGHAIICIGVSDNGDTYRLQFVDPNNTSGYVYANVSKNYNYVFFESTYGNSLTGSGSYEDFRLTGVGYYELSMFDLIDIDGNNNGLKTETSIKKKSSNSTDTIRFNGNTKFIIESETGEQLIYNGDDFSGDLKILKTKTTVTGNGVDYIIEVGHHNAYKVSPLEDHIDISFSSSNNYYAYSGTGAEIINVNMNDSVKAQGESMNCNLYMGIDGSDTDMVRIKNEDTDSLSLSLSGSGAVAEGNNIQNSEAVWFSNEKVYEIDEKASNDSLLIETPFKLDYRVIINNYTSLRTIPYKTTMVFTANADGTPDNAVIHWFIDEKDSGETGTKFTVSRATKSFNVKAKLIDTSGNVLAETDSERVEVNDGLFARIIAFFRSLLGRLPFIEQ